LGGACALFQCGCASTTEYEITYTFGVSHMSAALVMMVEAGPCRVIFLCHVQPSALHTVAVAVTVQFAPQHFFNC
jgi:hypothetical protein